MVTTRKDGTKVKEYLDPEDPRIVEIGITRKLKTPSSNITRDPDVPSNTKSFGKDSNNKLGGKLGITSQLLLRNSHL